MGAAGHPQHGKELQWLRAVPDDFAAQASAAFDPANLQLGVVPMECMPKTLTISITRKKRVMGVRRSRERRTEWATMKKIR